MEQFHRRSIVRKMTSDFEPRGAIWRSVYGLRCSEVFYGTNKTRLMPCVFVDMRRLYSRILDEYTLLPGAVWLGGERLDLNYKTIPSIHCLKWYIYVQYPSYRRLLLLTNILLP